MITSKDQDLINLLDEFHIMTSNQIHRLLYPHTAIQYTRRRLKFLTDNGHIKRTRSTIDNSFAYYINQKPVQVHHDLIRAELYTSMRQKYNILEWHNEQPIEHIRPDALCYVENAGIVFPVLSEIHLNKTFDFNKYKLDFKPIFGSNPRVIICTDRTLQMPRIGVKFVKVGLDMSGIDTLLK